LTRRDGEEWGERRRQRITTFERERESREGKRDKEKRKNDQENE
jgi:hypothetical protein